MRIKTILDLFGEARYMRSIIKRYGDSLARGKYYMFSNFRSMSLDKPEVRAVANKYFIKGKIPARTAKVANALNKSGYFRNKNKNSTEEYVALYSANNYDKVREIKLFSFDSQKILTICVSNADMQKQLDEYRLFGISYSMPSVRKSDKYPNALEISMVELNAFPGDVNALSAIAVSTQNFNPDIDKLRKQSAKDVIAFKYDNDEMNLLMGEILSFVSSGVLNIDIPLCIQHGDLSKDNLIYGVSDGKLDFWWIDWEHARERVFYYDYYFYIINSAMYYDTRALECYMNGECDEMMCKYFSHFGLVFEPDKRRDYLLIATVAFLKERVCDRGNVIALKLYCDFLKKQLALADNGEN